MLLGRYRVLRLIKRGGFAEVFEAVAEGENGFEKRVAIKRLLPHFASDRSIRRTFFDEARIASRLSHPNIVAIHDFGLADELPFQVLDLVEGSDVGTLAARPMPEIVAVHVVAEIARALEYAHAAADDAGQRLGIVHRDVTPPNILVSWSGDVRLADFGIARARQRLEETRLGVVKGTLEYMAPEQAQGSAVDGRADIYSLGCVLHRLITTKSPLADEAARERAIAGAALDLSPTLSEEVASIVRRATRARAEDRYPDAGLMADACWAFISKHAERELRTHLREWISAERKEEPTLVHPSELSFEISLEGTDAELDVKQFTTARTIAIPEATAVSARTERRPLAWSLAVLGALLLALAVAMVAARRPPSRSQDALPNGAAVAPIEMPSAIPRAMELSADEVGMEEAPADPRPPKPNRPKQKDPRDDLDARLAESMRRNELELRDLSSDPDTLALLSRFRASPSERTLAPLLGAIPELASAPPVLERRFRRALASLRSASDRISIAKLAPLEARYLALRERLDRDPSTAERRVLLDELRALESDLAAER